MRGLLLKTALAGIMLSLLTLSMAGMPETAVAVFDDTDGDGAIDIAEELSGSDPNNPNSSPEGTGAEFISGLPLCSDSVDNDLDGLTDGDDPDCTDSDNDIVSDPFEVLVGSDPNDASSFPEDSRVDVIVEYYFGIPHLFCADGVDNDKDGLTDGEDSGCETISGDGDDFDDSVEKRFGSDPGDANSVPEHEVPNPGSCSDGIDNDLDGLTDAADPACSNPANDDLADASVISALPYTDGPRPMKNATSETGEPRSSCSFFGQGTVWYAYTPPEDTVLIADTRGSDVIVSLSAYRRSGSRYVEVACGAGYFLGGSRVAFQATAGETYFFQVDGISSFSEQPVLQFNLTSGTPPANDNFLQATPIGGLPFTDTVNVEAATTEVGEPSCFGPPTSTVWYAFTPATDTLIVADTEGSASPSGLAVWEPTVFGLRLVSCVSPYEGARTAFEAVAGQTYYVQVSGFPFLSAPTTFDVTFNLDVGVPPANDDFENAADIASLPFEAEADLLTATTQPDEPLPACGPFQPVAAGGSVWYRYTPSTDAFLVAEAGDELGSSTVIGVYSGSAVGDLVLVTCGFEYYTEAYTGFEAEAGVTYYFQVLQPTAFGFFDGPIPFAGEDEAEDAGFPIVPGQRRVHFGLEEQTPLECSTHVFDVGINDPEGDATGPPGTTPPDITSIVSVTNSEAACFTIEFAGPIDPPDAGTERSVRATIAIDTDKDRTTGVPTEVEYSCRRPAGLGAEVQLFVDAGSGQLVRVFEYAASPGPVPVPPDGTEPVFGTVQFDGNRMTVAIPVELIGGDNDFAFAVAAGPVPYGTSDCAPNGGHLTSPSAPPPGDANCDGTVNSIDAVLILQWWARLVPSLPCHYVADVNANGDAGPLDALLILQYEAGMVTAFPLLPAPSA